MAGDGGHGEMGDLGIRRGPRHHRARRRTGRAPSRGRRRSHGVAGTRCRIQAADSSGVLIKSVAHIKSSHDAGREEVGQRGREQGAEAEPGQVGPAVLGHQGADAADLDADRADVGEAAEGDGGDRVRTGRDRAAEPAEVLVGDQLVEDRPLAEQAAHLRAVGPGDAEQPGDRGQQRSRGSSAATASASPTSRPPAPRTRSVRAIRARNAISIAATFKARARPSRVPRAAASRTLASGRSSCVRTVPRVSGISVSGRMIFAR